MLKFVNSLVYQTSLFLEFQLPGTGVLPPQKTYLRGTVQSISVEKSDATRFAIEVWLAHGVKINGHDRRLLSCSLTVKGVSEDEMVLVVND